MSSRLVGYLFAVLIGACSLTGGLSISTASALQFEGMGMFVAESDGSGFVPILLQPGLNPAPSPDGSAIAYGSGGPEGPGVSVVSWDGTGERRIGATSGFPVALSWSPDGTRIAFLSSDQTGQLTLSVLNVDGSGLTTLAPLGQTYASPPAWSPDGTRIAFAGPGTGGSDMWVVNADGSSPTQLTDQPGQVEAPAFSVDGTRIAFSEQQYDGEPLSWLRVVHADGSGMVDVATWTAQQDPGPDNLGLVSSNGPSWSPDGANLAIASITGIAIISADCSGAEILELPEDAQAFDVAYSPDGRSLAFGLSTEFVEPPSGPVLQPAGYQDIYVMGVDGEGLRLVGATPLVDRRPLWSPDGTRIVFSNEPAGE